MSDTLVFIIAEAGTYQAVIERGDANLSAYVPDLPGCVATGRDDAEVLMNMADAINMHVCGMQEDV
ncbi:unnamed protein product [marine sediment metagenome]|uniref:HicB-like antitoxin of toxin-antitoxin system domain-containing protein n=1 Tax=marine sediment metagenome TaxID=412755 RepID=X0V0I1_9ZZZZ